MTTMFGDVRFWG